MHTLKIRHLVSVGVGNKGWGPKWCIKQKICIQQPLKFDISENFANNWVISQYKLIFTVYQDPKHFMPNIWFLWNGTL